MQNDERYYRLLESTLEDIKRTQRDQNKKLELIHSQTKQTNGRVSKLELWRDRSDVIIKALTSKQGRSVSDLSAKTIYILAGVVLVTLIILAASLDIPIPRIL